MSEKAPDQPGNLADLVARAARRVPDHRALIDLAAGRTLTWAETDRAVDAFAHVLAEAGLAVGDRVMLRLPAGAPLCVALFAVSRAGGIAVPVAADGPDREVRRVLEHSGAKLVVGSGPVEGPALLPPPDLAPGDTESVGSGTHGEDIAVLCYTSGTVSTPRGVMLSHRALLANVDQCAQLRPAPVTANDRVLLAVPLHHVYGLGPGLLQIAAAGATAILMDHFGTEAALQACLEHKVTAIVGVPPMYQAFATIDEERLGTALAHARLLTSGAAPLPSTVLARIRALTGLSVFEGYGLTETGPVLTSTLVGGYAKPGSVGRGLPGVELRLVDSDGSPVGDLDDPDETLADTSTGEDTTGLVSARGQNLFSGYWPDGAHGPDGAGWFRTGDVGYFDADGDLHLVDRATDLVIVNGFNVYPHEVEEVLGELAGVAEAAVVGEPDERTGERVRAVLVLADGAELTVEQVRAHCGERLARFKVPSVVEFAESLPHSVTGKVRRASLRGSLPA
jgi:long-chain acyl-CoA synthetase